MPKKKKSLTGNEVVDFLCYGGIPQREFAKALETCSSNQDLRVRRLHQFMTEARYSKYNFIECVKMSGLSLKEAVEVWRDYQLARGWVQSMNGVPQVMADVVEDSKSEMVTCPRCDGEKSITVKRKQTATVDGEVVSGEIEVSQQCPRCRGVGVIRTPGDKDSRKLLYESMGLVGNKGPLVAQQFNISNSSGLPGLADTVEVVDKIRQRQLPQGAAK